MQTFHEITKTLKIQLMKEVPLKEF